MFYEVPTISELYRWREIDNSVTIAGGFLGALVAIVLMLLAVVRTAIFVKKGVQNHHLDPVH